MELTSFICLVQYWEAHLMKKDIGYTVKLVLKMPDDSETVVKEDKINNLKGETILRIISKDHQYHYAYSLNSGKTFLDFATTSADKIISKGYTGAYLGLFIHSTAMNHDFADFDWIKLDYPLK